MTDDEKEKCHYIIHSAATAGAAIGFFPIPGADLAPICAAQGAMIVALARVFKLSITDEAAKQIAKTFIVGNMGKTLVAQFCKLIPVLGSGINATVAAALTEALGWEVAEDFDSKSKKHKPVVRDKSDKY